MLAFSLAWTMFLCHDTLAAGAGKEENDMPGNRSEAPSPPKIGMSNSQAEGFDQALRDSKEFFKLTDQGDSLLEKGEVEEAIAEYKKAMKQAKLQADALYIHDRLAKAYEKAGRYEEALKEVKEIYRLWPHEETKAKVLKRIRDLEKKIQSHPASLRQ